MNVFWAAIPLLGLALSGAVGRLPNPALRDELLKMMAEDQALRRQAITAPHDEKLMRRVTELDRKHAARLREIVAKHGWPGRGMVGDEGAEAAWLLVQHADRSPDFQKECLPLIKAAAEKGEAQWIDYAYLLDRVRLAEGGKQVYGTQFQRAADGKLVPAPLEDPEHVDQRRKEIGLPPLAEYRKFLEKMYGGSGG